jgi:Fe2+ or Zn2+ uptake regulation protein
MTHFNLTVTALPDEFVQYCHLHQYNLSVKKKHIIAHVLKLAEDADVDTLSRHIRFDGVKVSTSSIYLVLQWLIQHGFVVKTTNGRSEVFYRPVSLMVN